MAQKDQNVGNEEIVACHKKTSIGGQALIEGIMMRGPKLSAMAVRNTQGEIVIEKWETQGTERAKIFRLPFIRGIFNFIDTMASGYKCLMRSAEISGLEEIEAEMEREKQEKKAKKAAARAAKKGKTPEQTADAPKATEETVTADAAAESAADAAADAVADVAANDEKPAENEKKEQNLLDSAPSIPS